MNNGLIPVGTPVKSLVKLYWVEEQVVFEVLPGMAGRVVGHDTDPTYSHMIQWSDNSRCTVSTEEVTVRK